MSTNRPLISITNVIWSFDQQTEKMLVLLIKRSLEPFQGQWGLPTTYLRENESADEASLRLVKEKIGVELSLFHTEQLATFTNVHRTADRELALTYMIYLPDMPQLEAGFGADDVAWFTIEPQADNYALRYNALEFTTLTEKTPEADFYAAPEKFRGELGLAADHALILRSAFLRIKNRLDYLPTILLVVGSSFTLRAARIIYAIFLRVPVASIDNSNFRKTHKHLFVETGLTKSMGSGRPAKTYQLKQ